MGGFASEVWKWIPQFRDYQASSLGRIRSRKTGHYRVLKLKSNKATGYSYVTLHTNDGPKTRSVHRLVASAFLPNPNNLPDVNHINEDKSDNRVENLEWCSSTYNNVYSKWKRQKPVDVLTADGELIATFAGLSIAASFLGVTKSSVTQAVQQNGRTCKGFTLRLREEEAHEYPGIDTRRAGQR